MNEEMVTLKARLFDTEEALKLHQGNFNQLVGFLMQRLHIEAETLQEFIEKLEVMFPSDEVEAPVEDFEEVIVE